MYPNLTDWFIRSEYQMARKESKFLTADELNKIAKVLEKIGRGDAWACTPAMLRNTMRALAAEYGAGAA